MSSGPIRGRRGFSALPHLAVVVGFLCGPILSQGGGLLVQWMDDGIKGLATNRPAAATVRHYSDSVYGAVLSRPDSAIVHDAQLADWVAACSCRIEALARNGGQGDWAVQARPLESGERPSILLTVSLIPERRILADQGAEAAVRAAVERTSRSLFAENLANGMRVVPASAHVFGSGRGEPSAAIVALHLE